MIRNFFLYIFELIKMVVIALVIIIPIRYFLIQPFYVKGASMEPSFYDSEYLIINEISYRFEPPKRGDIVVFRYPKDPQEYFIKRVIGLPGEKVQLKNGEVYIYNQGKPDGVALPEPYLAEGVKTYSLSEDIITLQKDEYFVLGDNRNSSKDSRSFGPVNKSFLIGKVMLRGWPFNRVNLFSNQEYSFN
jgi:signal peptidase I